MEDDQSAGEYDYDGSRARARKWIIEGNQDSDEGAQIRKQITAKFAMKYQYCSEEINVHAANTRIQNSSFSDLEFIAVDSNKVEQRSKEQGIYLIIGQKSIPQSQYQKTSVFRDDQQLKNSKRSYRRENRNNPNLTLKTNAKIYSRRSGRK